MRYQNIFSGELVTKIGEGDVDHNFHVHYRRDNAITGEYGQKMTLFTKPSYVFNQCYIKVNENKTSRPVPSALSSWA